MVNRDARKALLLITQTIKFIHFVYLKEHLPRNVQKFLGKATVAKIQPVLRPRQPLIRDEFIHC